MWHHEYLRQSADEKMKWAVWLPERQKREQQLLEESAEEAKKKRKAGRGR